MKYLSILRTLILSLLIAGGMLGCGNISDVPPRPYGPVPTVEQLAWQKMEYYMLIHFGPNTFTDQEWGTGKENPSVFNPASIDCRQWAATAKAAGMKGIIITAKHHDGFCLWPSNFSKHTVRESLWKNGKGDVLRELAEACREYDLKFGIYLSAWDRNHPAYGTAEYNQVFAGTLTEVLSNYGTVFEQWINGANGEGPKGKLQLYDWKLFLKVVNRNQPAAIITSDIGPGARWVGNVDGVAGDTNWSKLNTSGFGWGDADAPPADTLSRGNINGEVWIPSEANVSIRPGWFYSPSTDDKLKSLNQLMNIYYTSIGRNSNLLLNVPPDRTGRISRNDSIRLMEFRKSLDQLFEEDLIQGAKITASQVRGNSERFSELNLLDANYDSYWATDDTITAATIDITFRREKTFNRILLQEYIPLGQRISRFDVEYMDEDEWKPLVSGTTIGYKRMLRFHMISTKQLRVHIRESLASPVLNKLALFAAKESISDPRISRDKYGNVSIECETPDPLIYYTTNGSKPSEKSQIYKESFPLPKGGRVRAIAMVEKGTGKSKVISEKYDIAPSLWTVVSPSSEEMSKIIDGDNTTYADIYKNHTVSVDLGEELSLRGFSYTPSGEESAGNIFRYNLYTSLDGRTWTKVIDNASFPNMRTKPARQNVMFARMVKARYIKIMNLEAVKRGPKYTIAELGVITK